MAKRKRPEDYTKGGMIFSGIVLFGAIGFFATQCALGNIGDNRTAEERQFDREVARETRYCSDDGTALNRAYQKMQDPVAAQVLSAPSTAEFHPVYEARGQYLGRCRHEFFFWVESQNPMGATVRNHLHVQTRYSASRHEWTVTNVSNQ